MNFRQLKDLTVSYLDDLQFGYFTEPQVSVWLNNAQTEVQKRLINAGQNYYVRCVQTTLVNNQREYVLPQDFKKEHRIELVIAGTAPSETTAKVFPVTLNQQHDFIATGPGTPECYYFKRNRMILRPAPSVPYVLRLFYSYQVTDMVIDADIPDVPEAYHQLISLLAVEDGFLKDTRVPDLILKKIAEFQTQMDTDSQERNQDVPRPITETGFSNDGGFFW